MIAPGALVGDVHSSFALAGCHYKGAVQVDRRPLKELLGLPGPDLQPRVVGSVHQAADVGLSEATAEVSGRGWVGNSLCAQGVEKDFVIAPQFNVLQSHAVAQRVVRQVQHVIRLMVGTMDFQQMHAAINGGHKADLSRQLMHQTNSTHADGTHLVGQFDADVGCGEHRLALILPRSLQPPQNALLGFAQTILYTTFHSKPSVLLGNGLRLHPLNPGKRGGFRAFLEITPTGSLH